MDSKVEFTITSKTKAKAQKRRIKNESKWVTLRINSVQDQRCQNLRGKMTMNIRELKKALKAAGIPAESYNLDGKGRDDEDDPEDDGMFDGKLFQCEILQFIVRFFSGSAATARC